MKTRFPKTQTFSDINLRNVKLVKKVRNNKKHWLLQKLLKNNHHTNFGINTYEILSVLISRKGQKNEKTNT